MTQPTFPWWQNGTIYQIYPKSFQDSGSQGQGDLRGIIQRLDYLQWLGVDAIWITPIYVSPQVDNGYDVADYCAIDPAYGTMEDFDCLVSAARSRGIRIIMDMVFNHTSTAHPWFIAAQHRDSRYRDFYIWRDKPNNWQSKFGGSAWRFHDASGQYYLHSFAVEQADLNWRNPEVRAALKDVCRFWAEKGVAGLRLDVINLVSKHPEYPDDPAGDGRRFYTDGPEIHDFLQEFNREVFQPLGLMTVGEMSSTSLAHCQRYAQLDGRELSMTFNFHHLKIDYPNGEKWTNAPADLLQLKTLFHDWQQGMHNRAWNALFWCNHDQPRIVSRLGDEGEYRVRSAIMLAMVLHGMQGTPYIYQGEEIGMTNPHFNDIAQYRDVESLNAWQRLQQQGLSDDDILAILAQKSRDNARTPMQWDASPQAGFTQGTPWIPLADNADSITVAAASDDPHSVLQAYRRLIFLRKHYPILTLGDYQDLLPEHPALWCYARRWQAQTLVVMANLTGSPQPIDKTLLTDPARWRVLYSNYGDACEAMSQHTLRPWEAVWWQQEG